MSSTEIGRPSPDLTAEWIAMPVSLWGNRVQSYLQEWCLLPSYSPSLVSGSSRRRGAQPPILLQCRVPVCAVPVHVLVLVRPYSHVVLPSSSGSAAPRRSVRGLAERPPAAISSTLYESSPINLSDCPRSVGSLIANTVFPLLCPAGKCFKNLFRLMMKVTGSKPERLSGCLRSWRDQAQFLKTRLFFVFQNLQFELAVKLQGQFSWKSPLPCSSTACVFSKP